MGKSHNQIWQKMILITGPMGSTKALIPSESLTNGSTPASVFISYPYIPLYCPSRFCNKQYAPVVGLSLLGPVVQN